MFSAVFVPKDDDPLVFSGFISHEDADGFMRALLGPGAALPNGHYASQGTWILFEQDEDGLTVVG